MTDVTDWITIADTSGEEYPLDITLKSEQKQTS